MAETFLCGRACGLVAGDLWRVAFVIDLRFLSWGWLLTVPVLNACTVPASGAARGRIDCDRGKLPLSASQDRLRFQSIIVPVATPSVASDLPRFLLGGVFFNYLLSSRHSRIEVACLS